MADKIYELEDFWNQPDTRTWWQKFKFDVSFKCSIMWYDLHSDEFRKDWWIFRHLFLFFIYGFKPIAMGQYFGEDVFIFETPEEAKRGFEVFERGKKVPDDGIESDEDVSYRGLMCAWWYGKKEFEDELIECAETFNDGGNTIGGGGESIGTSFYNSVSFDFIKLWEK